MINRHIGTCLGSKPGHGRSEPSADSGVHDARGHQVELGHGPIGVNRAALAGLTPSVDTQAVMDQRHRDGVEALITYARAGGIPGSTVTVGSDGPVGSAAVDGPIAVLHLTPRSLPMDLLIDLCRRVPTGGLVIVDGYDVPSLREVADEIRSELAITSPLEIMDWSGVWWRM